MGVKSPGKGPKCLIKEMKVTKYLKCNGGRGECNPFCISGLFKANKPTLQGFLFWFFFFLTWSKLNGIFVWPDLKFDFTLFRLVMVVELLTFHPKTEGNIPSVLPNMFTGQLYYFLHSFNANPIAVFCGLSPSCVAGPTPSHTFAVQLCAPVITGVAGQGSLR